MSGGNWKDLFLALQTNDLELVRYHLRMGVDPNYQHPEFMAAPLVESIRYNHLEVARLLLENGADPAIKEVMGEATPTSVARSNNNTAALQLLNSFLL